LTRLYTCVILIVEVEGMESQERYRAILREAEEAGRKAGDAVVPVPMVVVERASPLDDNSPVVREYPPVMGGVCGFAWVTLKPATSAFAKFLKKAFPNDWNKAYEGGLSYWVHGYGQSMTRKEAFAHAYAAVLREYGFKAYANSRMD
jgi:hypothetical protein